MRRVTRSWTLPLNHARKPLQTLHFLFLLIPIPHLNFILMAPSGDPSTTPDLIVPPVRHLGLGLRQMNDYVGAEAPTGTSGMISRNPIALTDGDKTRHRGLYPPSSISRRKLPRPGKVDTRFFVFTDGRSRIGTWLSEALNLQRRKFQGAEPDPLSMPEEALRPTDRKQPKLQNELTKQVEECRVRDITGRFHLLRPGDWRRTAFKNLLVASAIPPHRRGEKARSKHRGLPHNDPEACT